MKKLVWLCFVLMIVVTAVGCFGPEEPVTGMGWLQSLKAEDVASIRFSVAENPLSYTDYEAEELPEILGFLKSCVGTRIEKDYPQAGDGQRKYFYVTMTDGTVHTFVNWGSYVRIDGEVYKDCEDWLTQWPAEGRVQVDELHRMLNALERIRTGEQLYVNCTGTDLPEKTWMRFEDNWYKLTDDDGQCSAYLSYEGRQFWQESRYIGPHYLLEDTGWQEEALAETFDLPWPLDEQQDPADYEYVETTYNQYEVPTATLRYLPDGTLLHLIVQEEGGWVSSYDVETTDGTVIHHNLWNPSSLGTALEIQGNYMYATGQTGIYFGDIGSDPTRKALEAQAERCRAALAEFQAADSYSLMETDTRASVLKVWNSGDNWLRQYNVEVRTETYLQYEGRQYQKYTSTTMTKPWTAADLSGEAECRDSWLREYQWDPENTYCEHFFEAAENPGHTRVNLFVLDDEMYGGYYRIGFTLDEQGRLLEASKNWTVGNGNPGSSYVQVYYNDGDAVESHITDTYREAAGE